MKVNAYNMCFNLNCNLKGALRVMFLAKTHALRVNRGFGMQLHVLKCNKSKHFHLESKNRLSRCNYMSRFWVHVLNMQGKHMHLGIFGVQEEKCRLESIYICSNPKLHPPYANTWFKNTCICVFSTNHTHGLKMH